RVGEAVGDMAIGVDLPVAAGLGQLSPKCHDLVRRDHRVVPAVEGDDLCLDLLGRQARRVEQAMEADRGCKILAGPGEVERALAAEAIAGGNDLTLRNFAESADESEDVQ